jgi:hypothetical protein
VTDDAALVGGFRKRLWAHNLGTTVAAVSGFSDILSEWDKVAKANQALIGKPEDMAGEGVLTFDFEVAKGEKSLLIPDELAYMDFDNHKPPEGEIVVVRKNAAVA